MFFHRFVIKDKMILVFNSFGPHQRENFGTLKKKWGKKGMKTLNIPKKSKCSEIGSSTE